MDGDRARTAVDAETYVALQRFYADEAALLDANAYVEWFGIFTDDIHYRILTPVSRARDHGAVEHAIVDELAEGLNLRVRQLDSPKLTIAENPASFHRRFVANLRADLGDRPGTIAATTNLLVYRNRPATQTVDLYAAERTDAVVRIDGGFRVSSRVVRLDQSVLAGGTLNTLL